MSYCSFVNNPEAIDSADFRLHKHYHDHYYGFPIAEDDELFGRLLLEINQAGLSWTLMLRRQENFRQAYDGFSIDKVAAYTAQDVERLLNDAGIIRNRLKINAAIFNAQRIVALREDYGSWKGWLDAHHPLTKPEWVKLFKKNFRFTGGEIVGEFLMSTGYLPGAHLADCPIFTKLKLNADRN